jgi:DNA helicase IV
VSSGGKDSWLGEHGGEQEYVTRLYDRLDELRQQARQRLDEVLVRTGLGHQGLAERDVSAAELAQRLARLDGVESGLCFGRIDLRDGGRHHIGRIGILGDPDGPHGESGESGDELLEPLLIDWRAPAARPFYTATAISHESVRRRRHISTSGRKVTGVKDEEFDGTAEPAGDSALLDALNAARTGRMSDIVSTIQTEQDEIIRSRHTGVLVVQGGPGTGKTAVALHRAAYLLYTQRERLARSVVLIVGPNPTFLRYIGEVLPSLGETGVLLATVDELYPGVRADRPEPPETAEIKGRLAMAEVIAAAVRDRQRVPDEDAPIAVDYAPGEIIALDRAACEFARARARASRLPHNEAAPLFRRLVIDALAHRLAERYGTDVLDGSMLLGEDDIEDFRRELRENPRLRAELDALWPALTPRRLLTELFASPERLARAAPRFTEAERAALRREGPGWAPADVPLLDEAAELLGTDPSAARAAGEAESAEHAERLALAQQALDIAYGSRITDFDDGADPEVLSAFDLLDAERLAERQAEADHRTPAERAAADRTWAFGHIVVDEAQELSAMAWRLLMRRCPARSMTVVGDIAQTSDAAGAPSWERVLAPHVGERWRLAELTVNYRLPAEIAELAAGVLRRIDPARTAPGAVRASGVEPWRDAVPPAALAAAVAERAALEAAEVPDGRVGVIVPAGLVDAIPAPERVTVLDPRSAKGLEFDSVIVADPARMTSESPRGLNDLYVALTRATQRLCVLHPAGPGQPPDPLRRLRVGPPRPRGRG